MHSRFDRSHKEENGFFEKWGIGFVVLPILLAIAMIVLSMIQPPNTNWVAESVQAELAGKSPTPADAQAQNTKPSTQTRTVSVK